MTALSRILAKSKELREAATPGPGETLCTASVSEPEVKEKWWRESFQKMTSLLDQWLYLTGLSELSWEDCQDAWFECNKLVPKIKDHFVKLEAEVAVLKAKIRELEMRDLIFRYSMINAAHFCLNKAKLQYIDGIKAPGKMSAHFVFGTAFHTVPEAYFDGSDPIEAFKMYWSSINPEDYDWSTSRQKYDELGQIGEELARKWLKQHAKHYRPLHIEKDVTFTVNGFKITGKPDFIGYYKDKLSIVDWKTSGGDFDKHTGLVNSQTWLYVEAAKQVYGLDIEQVVYAPFVKYMAKVQNPIAIEVTPKRLKDKLDNCTLMMRDLSTRTEFPKNESNCLRCDYKPVCYKDEL